jgi:beta-galactosidase/beta-glucuronidase
MHTTSIRRTHRACTPRRPLGSFSERAAAKSELRTQIRLSQSHPAITAWLIGNEANGPWQQVRVRVGEP